MGPIKVEYDSNLIKVNGYNVSDSNVTLAIKESEQFKPLTNLPGNNQEFYLVMDETKYNLLKTNGTIVTVSFDYTYNSGGSVLGAYYNLECTDNKSQKMIYGNLEINEEEEKNDRLEVSVSMPESPTKEQVSIKVKKIWDHQDYTGTKPTQIKINIYRNGILCSQPTVNTGSYTDYIEIGKFDKCDSDDNEYTYTIDEEVITGTNYTYAPESITGGKTADGKSYEFTITNKYSPPKPTFEKENTDSLPPIKIQINKVLERNR